MVPKLYSFEEIGIQGQYSIAQIPSLDPSFLCKYDKKTHSLSCRNGRRASLHFDGLIDQGSYGNVYHARRDETFVLVKQPRMEEMNLLQEAILQHLAYKTLEGLGIPWAIPKVYDVFWKDKEICFSMERIDGMSISDWFTITKTPDQDTLHLLAQVCLILASLETYLNLDHRDLKTTNLLIKPNPCHISLSLGKTTWELVSSFTVVVLDFGFACLGSEAMRGTPLVNLGDGVLPPMDPCPKEGRDIFHLLVSLLGLPIFREKISKSLHEKIDGWLSKGKQSYGPMARRWSTNNWSYLVSSQPDFAIPSCCPLKILHDISPPLLGVLKEIDHGSFRL